MGESQRTHHAAAPENDGRPCPYVPLDPGNEVPAMLIEWGMAEHVRQYLAAPAVEALLAGVPAGDRYELLSRARAALTDRRVLRRLYPHAHKDK